MTLLAFICMLGPLVFFHELGHYLVARLFRIPAETFSIGFGREILGWTDRQGTRWKVAWLPLGGYVKFVGDMSPASNPADLDSIPEHLRDKAFQLRPVWQRFLVVLAGPAANFLLAIVIFAAFFMTLGAPRTNIVGEVVPNTAAATAGLKPGDKILSIAGRDTRNFDDIRSIVMLRPDETVPVRVQRGNSVSEIRVHLQADTVTEDVDLSYRAQLRGWRFVYLLDEDADELAGHRYRVVRGLTSAEVFLDGVVHGCRLFGPAMVERGRGHVVIVSSGLGYTPRATEPGYVTTKAAVLAQ